jgi:hypothetical protein
VALKVAADAARAAALQTLRATHRTGPSNRNALRNGAKATAIHPGLHRTPRRQPREAAVTRRTGKAMNEGTQVRSPCARKCGGWRLATALFLEFLDAMFLVIRDGGCEGRGAGHADLRERDDERASVFRTVGVAHDAAFIAGIGEIGDCVVRRDRNRGIFSLEVFDEVLA